MAAYKQYKKSKIKFDQTLSASLQDFRPYSDTGFMGKRSFIFLLTATPTLLLVIGQACSDTKLSAPPVPITTTALSIKNYCPLSGFKFKDVFAYNSSAQIAGHGWSVDTDRDGLVDSLEQSPTMISQFGIDWKLASSSNPSYSDLMMVKMGLGISSQYLLPNCADPLSDQDNDGLNDCTEAYILTDKQKADTDGDGIPDGIEFRFGLNPIDPNDAFQSIMGDGLTNLDKIKGNIPLGIKADENILKLQLRYTITPQPLVTPTNPQCYDITVSNIPIVDVSNGNKIMVYVLEDKPNFSSGTTVLDRETRWLSAVIPKEISNNKTVIVSDGIHQQTIDGKSIPLVVIPGGGI